jgi:CHRD domain
MKLMTAILASVLLLFSTSQSQATPVTFNAILNGANEPVSNLSTGVGYATVIFDIAANTMEVAVTFADLTGTTTASHIHCCTTVADTGTAGVATTTPTFTGFPVGVTSGSYSQVFDMTLATSYNPAFITANGTIATAEADLYAGLLAETAYFNIHTLCKGPSYEKFSRVAALETA